MITYEVDILDVKTKQVRRTPMWAGWTEHSPKVYHENFCDCNLYGYRERGHNRQGVWEWTGQPHEGLAYTFIRSKGCDHSMPPTRYRALKAYLQDGRVYDFERGEFT